MFFADRQTLFDMKTNKVIIEQNSLFDDVKIIGITSTLIDYKIAIALDRAAKMTFNKLPDIIDEGGTPYSFYMHKLAGSETSCDLIALTNKRERKSWLGPLPITIDYLLIIRGNDANDSTAKKIVSMLSSYPNINTYIISSDINAKMQKIYKKIESLILESAEMHELAHDTSVVKRLEPNIKYRKLKKAI